MGYSLLLVSVFILLLILGIAVFLFRKKTPIDYYGLFVLGIIWSFAGIFLGNFPIALLGLIFIFIGFIHKGHWRHGSQSWAALTKEQRSRRMVIMTLGIIALLAVIFGIFVLSWKVPTLPGLPGLS